MLYTIVFITDIKKVTVNYEAENIEKLDAFAEEEKKKYNAKYYMVFDENGWSI